MNDEFLHALRRDPPPAFARELKRRLDRVHARRGARFTFERALLAMLLVGGVAMAAVLLLRNRDEVTREAAPIVHAVVPRPAATVPQSTATPQPGRPVTATDPAESPPTQEPAAELGRRQKQRPSLATNSRAYNHESCRNL